MLATPDSFPLDPKLIGTVLLVAVPVGIMVFARFYLARVIPGSSLQAQAVRALAFLALFVVAFAALVFVALHNPL